MPQAVAIIGANDFQNQAILLAKSLGYVTHVFAWADGAVGKATADYFYPISITQKEEILEICRKLRLAGVFSIGSDLAVPTVSYLATRLGLPGNSEVCAAVSTNKYQMRRRFLERGIPTPRFWEVADALGCDAIEAAFPLIVKPTDRSGSRGVTRVEDAQSLREAVARCVACSFAKKAIVEEFIEGDEYSAESITFTGRHRLLAVTKKFTTGAPHFIETGHVQPAPISPDRVQAAVYQALDALEITNGASHAEFKITPAGDVRLIEVGARMGGDCIGSDLVRLSTGYDFLRMTLDAACGKAPDFTPVSEPQTAFVRFLFGQEDLDVLRGLQISESAVLRRVSAIDLPDGRQVTDSSTRLGYYIGACADAAQFEELCTQIHLCTKG
ncbi:MAG: ATP-grasp domain-containing protein [Ethanoligenens sp.]